MNNSAFWKSDWIVGLVITLLFCAAYLVGFGPTQSLEYKAYDFAVSHNVTPADDRIVILEIDDDSIERIGRWPWPRSVVGDVIEKLSKAGAKLIGVDIFYSEKQQTPKSVQTHLQLAKILKLQGKDDEAAKVIAEARAMDEDQSLILSTRNSGNVFMPLFFDVGNQLGRPDAPLPDFIGPMVIHNVSSPVDGAAPLNAVKLHYPSPAAALASSGNG